MNTEEELIQIVEYFMNTEEELIQIVEYDPSYIQFIKNPSEKVQLTAVKQNGYSIRYINNPSEKVQLAAVNKIGSSIYFIQNPSEKVIRTAILNGAIKEDLEHIDISKLSDETRLMIELL